MNIKFNIEKFDNIVAALIIAGSILIFDVTKPQLLIGWVLFFFAGLLIIKSHKSGEIKNEHQVKSITNELPQEIKDLLNK